MLSYALENRPVPKSTRYVTQGAGIANGGVPGRGFSNSWTCCVLFAWKSVIAREFLLKINTSLAIATSGLRKTHLLFENPPFRKPPIRFSQVIPKTGIPKAGVPKVGKTHTLGLSPRQRFQSQEFRSQRDSENRDSESRDSEASQAFPRRRLVRRKLVSGDGVRVSATFSRPERDALKSH